MKCAVRSSLVCTPRVDTRKDDLCHFCALVFDVLSARTLATLRPSRADMLSRSVSSETKRGHLKHVTQRRSSQFELTSLHCEKRTSSLITEAVRDFMRGEWGACFVTCCTAAERG